jgi:hypothetical protein
VGTADDRTGNAEAQAREQDRIPGKLSVLGLAHIEYNWTGLAYRQTSALGTFGKPNFGSQESRLFVNVDTQAHLRSRPAILSSASDESRCRAVSTELLLDFPRALER